jgi:hypothetical protein
LFSGLVSGRYLITSESFGSLRTEDAIVVLDPGERKHVEIAVNPWATVTVRVVDTDGKPIQDARVQLPSLTWVDGRRVLSEVSVGAHENGGDGVFRITRVRWGEYYLRIQNPTPATARPGEDPLPMITYFPGVTDFRLATPIVVRGQDIDLGEVRMLRQKVFKVSGTIVRPATRAATANSSLQFYVRFHDTGSPEDVFPIGPPQQGAFQNTQETHFEISGLPAGTQSLYPSLTVGSVRYVSDIPMVTITDHVVTPKTVVTITDHDVEGLRIVLPDSVTLIGRVVVDENAATLLPSIRINLSPSEPIPGVVQSVLTLRILPRTAVPEPRSGEFALQNLSAGIRYSLKVNGLQADGYVSDIRLNNLSIIDEGAFVATAREQRLELEIGKGGSIRGVVRDATSQVVERATVVLTPEPPRRENALLYKRTVTDGAGNFTFTGVAPGDYQVLAFRLAIPTGAEEDREYLLPYFGRGASVRATQGATAETQLRVIEPR